MQATPTDTTGAAAPSANAATTTGGGGAKHLFDLTGIDRTKLVATKQDIEKLIPHRGQMSLLDGLIWRNEECTRGVAIKHVRNDEFWVAGHFPDKPIMPGVMMIETAAQLACYMFVARKGYPLKAVFLRIENAAFRAQVFPGEDLIVLCNEIKRQKRRFISDVQGIVGERVVFDAQLSGMSLEGLE